MTLAQEVDDWLMEIYKGAAVADLERGIAYAERMAVRLGGIYRPSRPQREGVIALRKHAEMLRAELKARQAEQNVEKEDALELLQKRTNQLCGR